MRETRTSGHLCFAKNEVGCHEGELVSTVHSLRVDQPGPAISRLTLQVLQADKAGSKSNHVKESIPLTVNRNVGVSRFKKTYTFCEAFQSLRTRLKIYPILTFNNFISLKIKMLLSVAFSFFLSLLWGPQSYNELKAIKSPGQGPH